MGQSLRTLSTIFLANLFFATFVQADPQTGGSKFPWEGELTGTNVYVRSGPGTNNYPALKIDAGQHVLVLGEKFGWYEIAPPEGCFSYIDMAAVERVPGSQQGRVKQDKVYARAGSNIVQAKTSTQVMLNHGDVVDIIGEADGFYKIEPPDGASLYVSNQYVQPTHASTGLMNRHNAKQAAAQITRPAAATPPTAANTNTNDPAAKSNGVSAVTQSLQNKGAQPSSPTMQPSPDANTVDDMSQEKQDEALATDDDPTKAPAGTSTAKPGMETITSSTSSTTTEVKKVTAKDKPAQPVKGGAGRYDALLATVESDLKAEQNKPRDKQDLEPLVKRYQEVAFQEDEKIPSEVAKIRLSQIKDWQRIRSTRKEVNAIAEDIDTYRSKMNAERMKIMRAHAESTLIKFDLEGELRKSYVFTEQKRRFRLVDPQRQTTIAYVEVPPDLDTKVETMIGRVVGIRTSAQRFDSVARVPIAIAASITDLSDRSNKDFLTPKSSETEDSGMTVETVEPKSGGEDEPLQVEPATHANKAVEPPALDDDNDAENDSSPPPANENSDDHH